MTSDYVAAIGRLLQVSSRQRARIMADIREHLDDAVAELIARGADPSAAEASAVAAFGAAAVVAAEFNVHASAIRIRRLPAIMAATGVLLIAGFVLAARAHSRETTAVAAAPARVWTQITFFAAVLGLQFAVVAGLRLLARVAAIWRTAPDAADVALVRHAGVAFVGGLVVASCGWSAILIEARGGLVASHSAAVAAGLAMMLTATLAAAVAIAGQWGRFTFHADAGTAAVRNPWRGGVGEWTIRRLGRWPTATCAMVALIAAIAAMSHAETTVVGALPWGAAEASGVIAGYLLLRRPLQLCSDDPEPVASSW